MNNLVNVKIFELGTTLFGLKLKYSQEDIILDTMYILSAKDKSPLQPILDIIKRENIDVVNRRFLIKVHNEEDYITSPYHYILEFDDSKQLKEYSIGDTSYMDQMRYAKMGVLK